MAFAGLKKQINKANQVNSIVEHNLSLEYKYIKLFFQYVTEKMGGAEGTKLNLDFMDMERVSIIM